MGLFRNTALNQCHAQKHDLDLNWVMGYLLTRDAGPKTKLACVGVTSNGGHIKFGSHQIGVALNRGGVKLGSDCTGLYVV